MYLIISENEIMETFFEKPDKKQSQNIKINTKLLILKTNSIIESNLGKNAYRNCMKRKDSPLDLAAHKIELFIKPIIKEIAKITDRKNSDNFKFHIDWLFFETATCNKHDNILTRALEVITNFENVYDCCDSLNFVPSDISVREEKKRKIRAIRVKKAFKLIKAFNYRLEFFHSLIKLLKNSEKILQTYFEDENKKDLIQL